jgi:hypothetical protein
MSIGKRVSEAWDKLEAGDPESALFAICPAVEATAKKEFGKGGRGSYKDFIRNNLPLITMIGVWGMNTKELWLPYTNVAKNEDLRIGEGGFYPFGLYPFEEIVYHIARCGLGHEAGLPPDLEFVDKPEIRSDPSGKLYLPASLVLGLIFAVVASPANQNEAETGTGAKARVYMDGPYPLPLNKLWGRRTELLWLLEVRTEWRRLEALRQKLQT